MTSTPVALRAIFIHVALPSLTTAWSGTSQRRRGGLGRRSTSSRSGVGSLQVHSRKFARARQKNRTSENTVCAGQLDHGGFPLPTAGQLLVWLHRIWRSTDGKCNPTAGAAPHARRPLDQLAGTCAMGARSPRRLRTGGRRARMGAVAGRARAAIALTRYPRGRRSGGVEKAFSRAFASAMKAASPRSAEGRRLGAGNHPHGESRLAIQAGRPSARSCGPRAAAPGP